jgi:hypothetical protein
MKIALFVHSLSLPFIFAKVDDIKNELKEECFLKCTQGSGVS